MSSRAGHQHVPAPSPAPEEQQLASERSELRPTDAVLEAAELPGTLAAAAPTGAGSGNPPDSEAAVRTQLMQVRLKRSANAVISGVKIAIGDGSIRASDDPEVRERKRMRKLFEDMDLDGSGTLSQGEIQRLVRSMGDRMSAAQIKTAMTKMDPEMRGDVTFERFARWWRYKKQEYRRDLRKKVIEIFSLVDEDESGELDKAEVHKLSDKVLKHMPGTIEFYPPFQLDEDFELMQGKMLRSVERKKEVEQKTNEHNHGEMVNIHEFVEWFKFRTGDDDPALPVLPEYIVEKIHVLSPPDSKHGDDGRISGKHMMMRTGKELWDFLRPRLKLLVNFEKEWGSMHSVYGTKQISAFESTQVPGYIRDPDSTFSEKWDIAQIIFLLYVAYAVPLRTAFSVEVAAPTFWFWVDLSCDIYFICDCILSFRTAFWNAAGQLEVGTGEIARYYFKHWFLIDFISSLPINYVMMVVDPGGDSSKFRVLRVARLLRLLRLGRIKRMMSKYQENFDAGSYMPLVFTMFAILFSAHMMACLWWFIGTSDGERTIFVCMNADCSLTVANGTEAVVPWAKVDPMWCGSTTQELNDCATRVDLAEVSLGARYIRSMFNIFNKEVVNTEAEHFFAVVSELVVGFIYGGLAGVISSLMMNSGASEQEMVQKMVALKTWMKSKKMTKKMRMKIQAHFEAQTDGGLLNESDILSTLPASLSSEISMFMYYAHVKGIPIFKGMGNEVIKKLCDSVQAMKARKDQVVFEEGSIGSTMYHLR